SSRLTAAQLAEARRRATAGESRRAVARDLGVAHSTLGTHLRAAAQVGTAAAPGVAAPVAGGGENEPARRAALEYVERLEAAYQEAFAAIERLIEAIEAGQGRRRDERPRARGPRRGRG